MEETPSALQPTNRKRGRRRVTKKSTRRDVEGFLGLRSCVAHCIKLVTDQFEVTCEEPVWESFSEDEPSAIAIKEKSHAASKSKKVSGKGSGNIMSFFGRK